ncbi:MAG: site-2 protease family protein [Bacillaceae bacterium]
MENLLAFPLAQLPFVLMTIIVAFSIHEFSHAFVAYKFGDPTAKNQGRLTLSPLVHLDFVGTLLLLFLGFGWAKPVPVNRYYFKHPRFASILVTLAGPMSNLVIAFLALIMRNILIVSHFSAYVPTAFSEAMFTFFSIFISLNVVLAVFNMLPIPPLDGYRILEEVLPKKLRIKLNQYEVYGSILFLILVITPLGNYTIQPLFNTVVPFVLMIMQNALYPIFGF